MISIELWVVLSMFAAGFQTLRFAFQKVLSSSHLTPTGATFARFAYSAPIVAIGISFYLSTTGQDVSTPSSAFWTFVAIGGLSQVVATVCVVTLFKSRNFAVGVTLMKTEVILSVLVGFLVLGESVPLVALLAIMGGLGGVILLSRSPDTESRTRGGIFNRSMGLGLSAGLLFAMSAVCYRGASLEIPSSDPVIRAGLTLSAVTGLQMAGMALWLWVRDRNQIYAVWHARRVAVWVGLLSLGGSFCWFWAFTLQTAALVKAVGQVELIMSLITSYLFFGERSSLRELVGIAVLCASILTLVLMV